MPPFFFLSYAQADEGPLVRRFFGDLSDSIRVRASLSSTQTVGCYSALLNEEERNEGLQTSCMMLALLSPAFLRDKRAERDWQIFAMRKVGLREHETISVMLDHSITRISWLPYEGPLPEAIAQAPVFPGEVHRNQGTEAVATMLRSMGTHATRYAELVNSLADHILESTASFCLPSIESIPAEMPRQFVFPQKSAATAQVKELQSRNIFMIDGQFVRTLAEQITETAGKLTPLPLNNFFTIEKEITPGIKTAARTDQKYSVYVIDDDQGVLNVIKTTCDYSGEFNCETYQDPMVVLERVQMNWYQYQTAPDLFVIDLELLGQRIQGLELIEKLAQDLNIPSAIMAISGNLSGADLLNAVGISGAIAAMAKPFTPDELLRGMRHWSGVGHRRVNRRKALSAAVDETRSRRPVFLSYSSKDDRAARFITNNLEYWEIGVFYARDAIGGGDDVPTRIRSGLTEAEIFVALITDNYVGSKHCLAELGNSLDLKSQTRDHPLTIIPILYDSPQKASQDVLIARCIERNREVIMSATRPMDGFQTLLMQIQNLLAKREKT